MATSPRNLSSTPIFIFIHNELCPNEGTQRGQQATTSGAETVTSAMCIGKGMPDGTNPILILTRPNHGDTKHHHGEQREITASADLLPLVTKGLTDTMLATPDRSTEMRTEGTPNTPQVRPPFGEKLTGLTTISCDRQPHQDAR